MAAVASLAMACGGASPSTVRGPRPAPRSARPETTTDWAALVDPFIGTGGHGHTYPGATVPFGMVQLSPDTSTDGWDRCSGYHQDDSTIQGFSHTHLSGTGACDMGDVLLLPTVGAIDFDARARFSHAGERAAPGDYRVRLVDSGIDVELTATEHAGFHRYTFPATREANVLVDLGHGIQDEPTETSMVVENDRTISGMRRSRGWASDQVVYFVAELSAPFTLAAGERRAADPEGVRLAARFDTTKTREVLVKVGISAVDLDGARKNLAAEIPGWDFDGTRAAARRAWNDALGRVAVTDADPRVRRIFETAVYHAMLAPTVFSDADGRFRGADMKSHDAPGFEYYSTFSLWDTFRAAHPLYTLAVPERVPDFVRSLTLQAELHPKHWAPIWPLASWETECMIGQHAIPVVAEAIAKGLVPRADAARAYEAMARGATRYGDWRARGYLAADETAESASTTLEASYDDWALSQMAAALGKEDDRARFAASSKGYEKLFDRETGFFRPRLANGEFLAPFDPRAISRPSADGKKQVRDYTEGNAWQYLWFVPHDVPGLIALLGGREAFVAKLDALFDAKPELTGEKLPDVTGLLGQYAHGNEPSHHVAFLYDWAGAAPKTQARVREILETMYSDAPDGLVGNEDCGQMSAWYVLAALGMYPVNPPSGVYALSAPIVRRAEIHVAGKTFVVESNASKENRFVQSATLNGAPIARAWLTHEEIVRGGTLAFVLGPTPNPAWGTPPEE